MRPKPTRSTSCSSSEIIPEFYDRNESGIPIAWVERMRESMARLTPRFSANRTVREYTEERYIPAAEAYRRRSADGGAVGRRMVEWRRDLERSWGSLRFGEMKVETHDEQHVFEIEVWLGDLDPDAVRMELYADGVTGGAPVRQAMERGRRPAGAPGGYLYGAIGVGGPSAGGLHRAGDAALRRCRDPAGRRPHPVAAMTWNRPIHAS